MNMEEEGATAALRVERPTVTLRELALNKLRAAILEGRFQPGGRLVERRLCELLGVSRTVIREVLRHLESEGLVETLLHQGPVVARLDPDTVDQIYEMRGVIEAMAARACSERIEAGGIAGMRSALEGIEAAFKAGDLRALLDCTTAFYEMMFAIAGKKVAWDVVRNLNARINHLRALTLTSEGRDRSGPQELRTILRAIEARDPDAAERACRRHIAQAHAIARQRLGRTSTHEAQLFHSPNRTARRPSSDVGG